MGIYQRPLRSDELIHWAKGQDSKHHKYVAKINNRYFYTQEELNAYRRSKELEKEASKKSDDSRSSRDAFAKEKLESMMSDNNSKWAEGLPTTRAYKYIPDVIKAMVNKFGNQEKEKSALKLISSEQNRMKSREEKQEAERLKEQSKTEREKSGYDNKDPFTKTAMDTRVTYAEALEYLNNLRKKKKSK